MEGITHISGNVRMLKVNLSSAPFICPEGNFILLPQAYNQLNLVGKWP